MDRFAFIEVLVIGFGIVVGVCFFWHGCLPPHIPMGGQTSFLPRQECIMVPSNIRHIMYVGMLIRSLPEVDASSFPLLTFGMESRDIPGAFCIWGRLMLRKL